MSSIDDEYDPTVLIVQKPRTGHHSSTKSSNVIEDDILVELKDTDEDQ
jgi:hypothetical protein